MKPGPMLDGRIQECGGARRLRAFTPLQHWKNGAFPNFSCHHEF